MKSKDIHKYLAAISDSNRLGILNLLKKGKLCACQIHPRLNITQNLASHHLKVLKNLHLIESKKQGVNIIYSRSERNIKSFQKRLMELI